jgi:hypothetical protein
MLYTLEKAKRGAAEFQFFVKWGGLGELNKKIYLGYIKCEKNYR